MDQELLDLLSRLDSANGGEPLTDAELADAREQVLAVLGDIDRTNPSEDDLRVAADAAGVIRTIDAEVASRATAAEERATQLAEALDGIDIPEPTAEGEGAEGEGAEGTESPEGTTPVEGTEPPPDGGEPATAPATAEGEAVPVAAAAAPVAPGMPSLRNIAARTPKRHRPTQTATESTSRPRLMVASGSGENFQAGDEVDLERWARGVERKVTAMRAMQASGDGEGIYLGSIRYDYPAERMLDDNLAENERKITAVTNPDALAAAGGVCGPVAVDYSVTTIASADRPVRGGLAMFGGGRGGVRYILPHTLAAVTADGPASLWTQATDAAPGNSTKAHATFVCQTPQETYVDAVVSITQFGNFQARYFPEQVEQYLSTVDAVHSRLAEATLLAAMITGSTSVNAGNNGTANTGAATEYFAEMNRIAAAYRYRHRMPENAPLQVMLPEWGEDMFRADIARELPGTATLDERLAIADARIEGWLRANNLIPSFYKDNPTGYTPVQGWGVQKAGDADPWPTKMLSFVFHPGAWMFVDGGELNLGMVRDSTLNRTNDFQMFSETFEKAVFRGHESLAVTTDLCPDGARAATTDTTGLCATGS